MELIVAPMTMAAWASTLSTKINNDWYILNDTKHTPLLSAYQLIAISLQWRIQKLVKGGVQSLGTTGTS